MWAKARLGFAARSRKAPFVMLGLALVGIADAFYYSHSVYTGQQLWCPSAFDGCNLVAGSPYARIVGIPLGYFGLVYYLYVRAGGAARL